MVQTTSVPCHVGPSLAPSPVVPWHDLLPLLPPPASTAPPHPARASLSPPSGFVRTLHASPGAWPRSFKESRGSLDRSSTPYTGGPLPDDKKARAAVIDKAKLVAGEAPKKAAEWEIEEAAEDPNPPHPQWISVERWRREAPVPGGVTLIMLHANGMPKEDYHPALHAFLASPTATAAFGTGAPLPAGAPKMIVNDIFLLEDAMHGVSHDLNAGHLPPVYAWADLVRDTLNFILHVLPYMDDDAPRQLEWKQTSTNSADRTIIGIGHSLGGNAIVQASVTRPDLFKGLFLIDPMTQPTGASSSSKLGYPIQAMTLKRRDAWPSLSAAESSNKGNPMFSRFDPAVFDIWLKYGVTPTGNGQEVTLVTPTWAEACVFSDPRAPQRGWDVLPKLTVPVGFLMAEDPQWMGGLKLRNELVWRPPRARNEVVLGAGHLVVQEKPKETAEGLARFLATLASGTWDNERGRL